MCLRLPPWFAVQANRKEFVVFYCHGGGYTIGEHAGKHNTAGKRGECVPCRPLVSRLLNPLRRFPATQTNLLPVMVSKVTEARVFEIRYGLAPEVPCPGESVGRRRGGGWLAFVGNRGMHVTTTVVNPRLYHPLSVRAGGLDDTERAYTWLLAQDGIDAQGRNVVMVGDSAGGGLIASLLPRLREKGAPAVVCVCVCGGVGR